MSRKMWGVVSVVTMLTLAVCWWAFRGQPSIPANDPARSMFLRPTKLAPSAAGFGILIDGIDALEEVPTVACNQKVSLTVISSEGRDPNAMNLFYIVQRLPNQGSEGLKWTDISCDLSMGLNNPRPTPLGTDWAFDLQATFRLRPGEYVLRYYRHFRNLRNEEELPRTEFVGEGRLRVIPSPSTEPSFIPLENKKTLILNPVSKENP